MKDFNSGLLLPQHTDIFLLDDDGIFLNNELLPVVKYRHAFQIANVDEAVVHIEALLQQNGWHHPWRDGIFDYHHFHSTAHEVLVACAGSARVELGGPNGVLEDFASGDVLILPAGTAHRCQQATGDFECIGAYPLNQMFDICYGRTEERARNRAEIMNVPLPTADPVYGPNGPLMMHWQTD